jgi:hypothetical protein
MKHPSATYGRKAESKAKEEIKSDPARNDMFL